MQGSTVIRFFISGSLWIVFFSLGGCVNSVSDKSRYESIYPSASKIEGLINKENRALREGLKTLEKGRREEEGGGQAPFNIDLGDAIRMAMIYNPSIRRGVAVEDEQRSTVDVRMASYWPRLEGNISVNKIGKNVSYPDNPFSDYSLQARSSNASLSLTWVLYDSGLRGARLDSAISMLRAARFGRDETIRSVTSDTISAYYKAEFASVAVKAFSTLEKAAKISAVTAHGRVSAGSGSIADELLAASSYAQARLKFLEAQAEESRALSNLAAAIGVSRSMPIEIAFRHDEHLDFQAFNGDINNLISEAVAQYPRVRSAFDQLIASRYDVDASRAEGMPVLSLVGSTYQSMTPPQESAVEQKISGWSIGLQLKIPIFDGFARRGNIALANARVAVRQAELIEAKMDAESTIWNAFNDLRSATLRIQTAQELRNISRRALDVAQGRYKVGVGSITELLQAQGDVAEGTRQYVQAGADWYSAKMRLANSIGQLEVIK